MSVLLVVAALLCSASAMAQGTVDRIKQRGEIRIGYRTDARPLSFEENGQPAGYSVDICKRVAAGIGRSSSRARVARPREMRLLTVPIEIFARLAISRCEQPSIWDCSSA